MSARSRDTGRFRSYRNNTDNTSLSQRAVGAQRCWKPKVPTWPVAQRSPPLEEKAITTPLVVSMGHEKLPVSKQETWIQQMNFIMSCCNAE
ncbi:hypothetical protein lerEdw1_001706 [Lerista edwardsae]|nr:hypothetical protein lerEdw1_001706 [Lerista edwardsae]